MVDAGDTGSAIRIAAPGEAVRGDRWRPRVLREGGLGMWGLANLLAALSYCTLGWAVSQFFAQYGLFPSPIWLPSSIAVVAAMMGGMRIVPGLFLGSLVANYALFDPPIGEAVLISLGNALGPALGVAGLRRFRPQAGLFNRQRGVVVFILFAILLHPAITASTGVLALYAGQGLDPAILPGIWIKWWLSDSGGTLFFAPCFLLWLGLERETIPRSPQAVAHDPVFWAAIGFTAVLLFSTLPLEGSIRWAFPFLMVVPLSWIALRVSLRAAYTLISIVAVVASAGAVAGFGPFQASGPENPMQLVGVLVVLLALNVLTIIALVAERREAEEANRFKSMFLASASHDLRTPLNAIVGFSDMMRREILGPVGSDRYREYVQHIHDSSQVLMEVIDEILDLSRIEAGRREIVPEMVDAHALARSCLEIVSLRARERDVGLVLAAEEGGVLWADPRALRQILLNLIANAVTHTPPKGKVTVHVDARPEPAMGGAGSIEVSDTGIGMTAEEVTVALQPFGRVARSGDTRERGTGLGLPIAVRLSELHGGTLALHSTPGHGTNVRVTLPGRKPG